VESEVETWRQRLAGEGRLELSRIGVFFRDAEQNLQFDPDRRSNFLKDAFGLAPVAAVPVAKERPAPVVRTMQPPTEKTAATTRGTLRWAAAVAAMVALAAVAWWLVGTGGPHGGAWNLAGLLGSGAEHTYVAPAQVGSVPVRSPGVFALPDEPLGIRSVPLQVNDSVFITVDLGRPAAPVLPADSTHVAVATPPADVAAKLRYHVIGGCFADPANAERFLGTLLAQGHPAQRLPQRGALHPVAFGSYATRTEALAALERVRSGGAASAWLLVR
jgi:cell division septation protein DedD